MSGFEYQPTPTQLMIAARLKQNPHWRARLENSAQKEKDHEPDATKIYLATRIIETANDSRLYAYAIHRVPKHSEERSAATFNLLLGENLMVSQNRATAWTLGSLDRNLSIRICSSLYLELPAGYSDLQTRYVPDSENPAIERLNQYLRETHMF